MLNKEVTEVTGDLGGQKAGWGHALSTKLGILLTSLPISFHFRKHPKREITSIFLFYRSKISLECLIHLPKVTQIISSTLHQYT